MLFCEKENIPTDMGVISLLLEWRCCARHLYVYRRQTTNNHTYTGPVVLPLLALFIVVVCTFRPSEGLEQICAWKKDGWVSRKKTNTHTVFILVQERHPSRVPRQDCCQLWQLPRPPVVHRHCLPPQLRVLPPWAPFPDPTRGHCREFPYH